MVQTIPELIASQACFLCINLMHLTILTALKVSFYLLTSNNVKVSEYDQNISKN